MNKKRLHKSSDVVVSGVCGGIAEYFGIDPTLVRILTVVIFIAGFGVPIIVYVVCMIVLPPDPGAAQGYVDARAEATPPPCQRVYASVMADADAARVRQEKNADQPPPPDPATRVSAAKQAKRTGKAAAHHDENGGSHFSELARSHWSAAVWVGVVLIGIGIIALLCNIVHVSVWRFWPVVIVVAGAVSLFTPGPHGWSLERAGSSIVLITIGLALLAWMLQIVQTKVFVIAFWDLWPALLVVAGVAIIGSAQKSSVIKLASSLLFSAIIIFGIWFYAGLDWTNLGGLALLPESDGVAEFLFDITQAY